MKHRHAPQAQKLEQAREKHGVRHERTKAAVSGERNKTQRRQKWNRSAAGAARSRYHGQYSKRNPFEGIMGRLTTGTESSQRAHRFACGLRAQPACNRTRCMCYLAVRRVPLRITTSAVEPLGRQRNRSGTGRRHSSKVSFRPVAGHSDRWRTLSRIVQRTACSERSPERRLDRV